MKDLAPDITRQRLLLEGLYTADIDLYVWSRKRFFAAVLFTCKAFDTPAALDFNRRYFGVTQQEHRLF